MQYNNKLPKIIIFQLAGLLSWGSGYAVESVVSNSTTPQSAGLELVTNYNTAFATTTPSAGWSYLWNVSEPIGNSAGYQTLLGVENRYDSDGSPSFPAPTDMAYGHLNATGGHPGKGTSDGVAFDRYAIAAYTVATDGHYLVTEGQISHTGCEWTNGLITKVLVGDHEHYSKVLNRQETATLEVDLGSLVAGEIIYVAVGPNGSDGCDTFAMDFSITESDDSSTRPANTPLGRELYVDLNAPDSGDGTEARPWATFAQAVDAVTPGDTVLVRAGTYTEGLDVTQSGSPEQRITFAAYPDEEVILAGRCIRVEGQSHIVIRGFKVVECMGGNDQDNKGIFVLGPGVKDIIIENNHIDHTQSSAISIWGVPWRQNPGDYSNVTDIVIRNNLIEQANDGGYDEQITVSNGVVNFEIAFNEIRHGGVSTNGGEGIDIKEGSSNGTIHDNHIHDITRRAIYIDGGGSLQWFSPVHDIEVYNNVMHGVPNGFAIMTEGKADVNSVKVYNNLAYDVEYDCAFVYDHPEGTGKFNDFQFINNTFVDCGTAESWREGLDLNTDRATNILVKNNILTSGLSIKEGLAVNTGNNIVEEDPLFVDITNRNYRLRQDSPAVEAADASFTPAFDIENNARPIGAGHDIGAYQR